MKKNTATKPSNTKQSADADVVQEKHAKQQVASDDEGWSKVVRSSGHAAAATTQKSNTNQRGGAPRQHAQAPGAPAPAATQPKTVPQQQHHHRVLSSDHSQQQHQQKEQRASAVGNKKQGSSQTQTQQQQQQQHHQQQQKEMSRQESTWQHMKDFWFHNKDSPVLRERFARRVRFAAEWLLAIVENQQHPDRENLLEQLIDWCSIVIDADQAAELLEVSTENAVRSLRGRVFGALKTLCADFEHYTDAKRMQVSKSNPNKLERSYVRTFMHENMLCNLLADRAELLRLLQSGDKKDQFKPMEERNAELKRLILAFVYEIHLRHMCEGEGAAALAAWDTPEQRRIDAHLLMADVIGLVRNTVAQLSDSTLKELDDAAATAAAAAEHTAQESEQTRAIRAALGIHGPAGVQEHWSKVFLAEELQELPYDVHLPGRADIPLQKLFEQENEDKATFQQQNAREGAIVCLQLFGKDHAAESFDWTLKERYEHLAGGVAPEINLRYPNLREAFVNALADACPEPLPNDVHGPAERKFRQHVLNYFLSKEGQAGSAADTRNEEEVLTNIARKEMDVYLSEQYDYQVKKKLKNAGMQVLGAHHPYAMGHKARQQQQQEMQAAAESLLTDEFLQTYLVKTKKNTHGYLVADESSTAWSLLYFFMFAKELLRLRPHGASAQGSAGFSASSEHDHPWFYKERVVALLLRLFPGLLNIFDDETTQAIVRSPFFARRQTFSNREEMIELLKEEYTGASANDE